jgi:antitoxin (DNA-binding transcriptional repressor) of toxin-antitoxin stability system
MPVIAVALAMIALGETGGAVMSQAREPFADWVRARMAANPGVHGFAGSAEYDDEVRARTVFTAEAGLSFFHTHAEGVGVIVLVVGTVIATVVPVARLRAALQTLLAIGGLFPLGYLAYALLVATRGRDEGVALAETWVLTPLGTAMILAVVGVVVAVVVAMRRAPNT